MKKRTSSKGGLINRRKFVQNIATGTVLAFGMGLALPSMAGEAPSGPWYEQLFYYWMQAQGDPYSYPYGND